MTRMLVGFILLSAALVTSLSGAGRPHWPARAVVEVWISSERQPSGGDRLVERAMQAWTNASDGRLTLRRTLVRAGAGIEVLFVRGSSNYGETLPHLNRATGLIDHADVDIAADVPFEPFTRQIVAYLTALHELGHAIGLEHTADFADIMYLFRRPDDGTRYFGNYRALVHSTDEIGNAAATGLSAADVRALRDLYDGR